MKRKNIVTNTQNDPIIINYIDGNNIRELEVELLKSEKGKFYEFAYWLPVGAPQFMIVKANKNGIIKNIHRWTNYINIGTIRIY